MKFNVTDLLIGSNGNIKGVFVAVPPMHRIKMKELSDNEALKSVEIKLATKKRSLTANAYAWVLMDKIAKKLYTTDEEIYIQVLHDYGVKKYSCILESDVEDKKKDYKIVDIINHVKIDNDGKTTDAVQVKCIRGSSKYTASQFHFFLEGIINDCKELEIDVMTPNEIKAMMANYKEE